MVLVMVDKFCSLLFLSYYNYAKGRTLLLCQNQYTVTRSHSAAYGCNIMFPTINMVTEKLHFVTCHLKTIDSYFNC